jgi:hypothetical protein
MDDVQKFETAAFVFLSVFWQSVTVCPSLRSTYPSHIVLGRIGRSLVVVANSWRRRPSEL